MKYRKEFEAKFLEGREGSLLVQSQLDLGANGEYFQIATRIVTNGSFAVLSLLRKIIEAVENLLDSPGPKP